MAVMVDGDEILWFGGRHDGYPGRHGVRHGDGQGLDVSHIVEHSAVQIRSHVTLNQFDVSRAAIGDGILPENLANKIRARCDDIIGRLNPQSTRRRISWLQLEPRDSKGSNDERQNPGYEWPCPKPCAGSTGFEEGHSESLCAEGHTAARARTDRFTADTIALSDAVEISPSMPTPQRVWPSTSSST